MSQTVQDQDINYSSYLRTPDDKKYDELSLISIEPKLTTAKPSEYCLKQHLNTYQILTDKIRITWNNPHYWNQSKGFWQRKERKNGVWKYRQMTVKGENNKPLVTLQQGGNWCALDVYITMIRPDLPINDQLKQITKYYFNRYGRTPVLYEQSLKGKPIGEVSETEYSLDHEENFEIFWNKRNLKEVEVDYVYFNDDLRKELKGWEPYENTMYSPDKGKDGKQSVFCYYPIHVKEDRDDIKAWKLELRFHDQRSKELDNSMLDGTLQDFLVNKYINKYLRKRFKNLLPQVKTDILDR